MNESTQAALLTRGPVVEGVITSRCHVCGQHATALDKGLNRADLYAWESRHGGNCDKRAGRSGDAHE